MCVCSSVVCWLHQLRARIIDIGSVRLHQSPVQRPPLPAFHKLPVAPHKCPAWCPHHGTHPENKLVFVAVKQEGAVFVAKLPVKEEVN